VSAAISSRWYGPCTGSTAGPAIAYSSRYCGLATSAARSRLIAAYSRIDAAPPRRASRSGWKVPFSAVALTTRHERWRVSAGVIRPFSRWVEDLAAGGHRGGTWPGCERCQLLRVRGFVGPNVKIRPCRRSCSSRAIASCHLRLSLMRTLGLPRRALRVAPLAVKARHPGPSGGWVK